MIPGIDPKKMQAVMKQMGMSQQDIPSSKVIIEKEDGNRIIITNPEVVKIKMQGQESFQITGDTSDEESISNEDIQVIMEKTNCSEEEARKILQETGDLAEAILRLSD